jgi:alkanesulfonate monooxygenase SsuD/methylene tetrahydromethanopterin reductase-like flavin-dependent oxidoreductase (luciferase family)
MGATIDQISKGRFQLGAGAGWYQREYQRFGFNFPTFSEREARLDEAVDIISRLWEARGSRVWFNGKYYKLNGAFFSPEPYSKPRPKIFLGGRSMNILRTVVKQKHGLNIDQDWNMGPAEVQRTVSALDQLCQQSQVKKRLIDRMLCVRLFVGKTPAQVKRQLRNWSKESRIGHTATDLIKMKILRIAMAKLRGEFVTSTSAVIGDPNECVKQLLQYRSLGIDHFFFKVHDFRDQELLKLISDEVIKPLSKGGTDG